MKFSKVADINGYVVYSNTSTNPAYFRDYISPEITYDICDACIFNSIEMAEAEASYLMFKYLNLEFKILHVQGTVTTQLNAENELPKL